MKATNAAKVAAKASNVEENGHGECKQSKSRPESRGDTKKAIGLKLLRRKEGATIAEIAKAVSGRKVFQMEINGWKIHSNKQKLKLSLEGYEGAHRADC